MELRSGGTKLTKAKFKHSRQIIYNALTSLIPDLRYVPCEHFMNTISNSSFIGETIRSAMLRTGSHFFASEDRLQNGMRAVFMKDGVYVKGAVMWSKVDENGIKPYKGEPTIDKESVFIYQSEL